MPQSLSSPPHATVPPVPVRATEIAEVEGLRVVVTASRRITGVTVVATQVSGGPDDVRREFYTISQEPDPALACADAIGTMRRLLHDQGSCPAR